ncbi:hypothetical protein [Epilithonimonas sp. UC225_85]|uniref:hypothetical protein n=1 Tax=Epilithonimonas sp. UC225_85 TaxID=3350167 RepID=UPI0036D2853C
MNQNSEIIFKLSLPTFILLGLAKICSYYNCFHFPVIEYLNFTEMIMIFLCNLYVYFSLAFQFAVFFLVDKKHFRASVSLAFLSGILILIYNALSGNFQFDTANLLLVITIILLVAVAIIGASKSSLLNYLETFSDTTKKYIAAAFTIIVLLVISSFQGFSEAKYVVNAKIYTGTTIITGNKIIKSNQNFYFIGKTNEYIFFYNQKLNNVKVYPLKDVNEITYKTKSRY